MDLNQITIQSTDVRLAAAFYQKLGLRLIVDAKTRYVRFECPRGNSTLSISYSEAVQPTSTVIYFEVDNVDGTYQLMKSKGIDFTFAPKSQRWLWREAGLTDPDGHQLVIFSAGINRLCPPWRLSSKRWYHYLLAGGHNLMK